MNLQDFISQTLTAIAKGITEANTQLQDSDAQVNPRNVYLVPGDRDVFGVVKPTEEGAHSPAAHLIEFDVAVCASEEAGTTSGIGVVVAAIGMGSKSKTSSAAGSESRVKFRIPMLLPQASNQ